MNKPTDIGSNRTGIQTSPSHAKEMIEGAIAGSPAPMSETESSALHAMRVEYSTESPPVGTMPPPVDGKASRASADDLEQMNVFLDQLGARLAFERTGTRIYEALLVKFEAASVHPEGPSREDLLHIRDEELAHAGLLAECIQEIGGDPTVVTPAADVQAVASCGIVQVLGDPRTTFTQALEAVLTAELTDVDSWQLLVDMADKLGLDDMAERFGTALDEEGEHLLNVRQWLTGALLGQAGVEEVDDEETEEAAATKSGDGGTLHPPPTRGRSGSAR